MIYYVTYLKDTIGNNYLGIKFNNEVINPFLDKLKEEDYKFFYSIYSDYKNEQNRKIILKKKYQ